MNLTEQQYAAELKLLCILCFSLTETLGRPVRRQIFGLHTPLSIWETIKKQWRYWKKININFILMRGFFLMEITKQRRGIFE